ncbi:CcdC family protein [Paenibacillus selenitireducens]|nr:cytochrome c biogenesis protein CcdC [Paenibacillus selenitireducens]
MAGSWLSMHGLSIFASIFGGSAVIFLRLRAANKPTSMKKIIMPPVGMVSGFLMFVVPIFRVPWSWALLSFLVGAVLFSYPLIKTSRFEHKDNQVYLKRSNMFIVVIVGLLVLRVILHDVLEQYITVPQSAGLFFILAFGMLLPWRLAMLMQYRKLQSSHSE